MVMLTALLALLHQRYGRPCQLLAAGPWNAPLFTGHADVARLWPLPRHAPMALSADSWRAARMLRRCAPGPVYVAEYQPRQVRRIRRLLALAGIDAARCLFLPEDGAATHWVERLVAFGHATPAALPAPAYPAGAGPWRPHLAVQPADIAGIEEWLARHACAARALILIQPGNFRTFSRRREAYRGADDKAWPLERWVRLLESLHAQRPDCRVLLCGAPAEAELLQELAGAAALEAVVAAALPLRPFMALCLRAHSMISIDTGPAHVAAALGVPLVVLYGAENPARWLPRSPGSPVVAVGGPPRSQRVDALTPQEVLAAWETLALGAGAAAAAGPHR